MLGQVFKKPQKHNIFVQQIFKEIEVMGLDSIGIVTFISFFVGGVVVIQTALNLTSPLTPRYLIGFASRESLILEFSPTLISIILAGKVGSFITSSIGTMRVTEQIDAFEVMGVNSLNYLVLPKIVGAVLFYPFLITISIFMGLLGGWSLGLLTGLVSSTEYIDGIRSEFVPYHVTYSLIKTAVFAFVIASVPAYHGFYVRGGSIEVGKASTKAVVWTSVIIIVLNYFLTQMLLGG
ncbi:MAG: ABC transporter permease [Flavobacteriaceae bacterium]|nr:ABC transporter permease [Flavobacteriaceae bacterium]MCB0474885.1 ABC transporter permease [Flavobacteriaceae bacterium]